MSTRRSLSRCTLFAVICLFLLPFALLAQVAQPSFAEPAQSPDGQEIAFVSGSDVWTVPAAGGHAQLLVSHPATESRPLYSPDGKYIAFMSSRSGNGDIYVLEFSTGNLRRLTYDDASEQLDSWSPDGMYVYFSTTGHDIAGMNDIYRVPVLGGTPMPVTAERYASEFFGSPSPDGKTLAVVARGVASAQWWRNGHSHIDQTEIWKLRDGNYEQVVPRGAKHLWPMWSPDGKTLYYMSDRSGAENLWALPQGGKLVQLTSFTSGRVLWPSISRDGRTIVFERDFGVWRLTLADKTVSRIPIELRGSPAGAAVEHRRITDGIRDFALSPDGKKLAFIVRGEVFAAPAKDGGDAVRVTATTARESQVTWWPDNKCIVYVSDRDGRDHLFVYNFADEKETQLTRGDHDNYSPAFSPDGKMLAFVRNRRELVVLELSSSEEAVIATGHLDRPPLGASQPFDWSPDSRWIAYTSWGDKMFRNAHVVPVAGGQPRQVSFVPNVFSSGIQWSPDGKYLLLHTGQRTETSQIARIDLTPRTPKFSEDRFRDLFQSDKPEKSEPSGPTPDTKPSAQSPSDQEPAKLEAPRTDSATKTEDRKGPKARRTEIVLEGIRQRMTMLPLGLDADGQVISPDGKWLAVVAEVAGQQNIYVYPLDELSKEPPVAKQVTATRGQKGGMEFTPDGKELYYLDDGRISAVTLDAPKPRPIPVSAEMDVDFNREKTEAFEQGWRWLRDNFFDEKMNGADWNGLHTTYASRVAAAKTPDEMRRLMSLMIGELNASHTGVGAPMEDRKTVTGRVGLLFDASEYEKSGSLRITEVVPLSPAAIAGMKQGEFVIAVDGAPLKPYTNFDGLLQYKIGRKTTLTIASDASGSARRSVVLKPISMAAEKALVYRDWVKRNREYVDKVSGGRLGYVHMPDMSSESLNQLILDLDSDNHIRKGVVIDIRNNNGGFVNAYALDVLARRGYLTMTVRGMGPTPARTYLGQRSLELPTILVTNQHSLSDAEDFTEGYRALGLGKVIGEATAGWIIYTSNVPLIDGSLLRIPNTRITGADGTDMEMHPRHVDVEVQRPLGESGRGVDSQLDTAIRELLLEVEQQSPQRRSTLAK